MMWSCRVNPSTPQAFSTSFVIAMSASDGSGSPDDFARIDRHMIDGADAKAFVGNEPVLAVQVQDMKPLDSATHREGIMPKSA